MTPQAAGPEAREPASELETLLRDALAAEARTAVPYGSWHEDPWLRVDRAHRRGQARRRTGVAALLAVTVAATGGILAAGPLDRSRPEPAQTTTPPADTWQALDDGRPRGEPVDATTRAAVAAAMQRPGVGDHTDWVLAHPATLRFLWNGTLGGRRTSLVRAVLRSPEGGETGDHFVWVGQSVPDGILRMLQQSSAGPAVVSIPYRDGERGMRLLAVVRRGATAATTRAVVRDDGTVEETWTPVPVRDGVVDAPMGQPLTYAPLELRVTVPGRATQYTSAGIWGAAAATGGALRPLTDSDVAEASANARGDLSRPAVRADVRGVIEGLLRRMESDAAHAQPTVLWAGPTVPGESLVAVSAGYPGQGRLLSIRGMGGDGGLAWWYDTTLPVSPVVGLDRPVVWRTPEGVRGSRHVVGWLLPSGGAVVEVSLPGGGRLSPWRGDGAGTVAVDPGTTVRVRISDPDTREVLVDRLLRPADTGPSLDSLSYDRFPPGGRQ
jgi:hypothetical protein